MASGGGTAVATRTQLEHGSVVIAAITSCTNTSNPSVMIGAGLVARKAVEKASLASRGSRPAPRPARVVTDYLKKSGLDAYLDQLGFNLVGYGCTTCIGNSGTLPEEISAEINERGLVVASVLSGNRNFEGRIQQDVRANYLASPPLVVAYALAGTMNLDSRASRSARGKTASRSISKTFGRPSRKSSRRCCSASPRRRFRQQYSSVFAGDSRWQSCWCPPAIDSSGKGVDLHSQAAISRGAVDDPVAGGRGSRGARAGGAGRQHHHRPHLAGRQHQGQQSCGQLPDRARGRGERLQPYGACRGITK